MSPKEAAHKTMDEVGGALIAISLVLIAVFLPTAFITGLQGTFYKQFAITIAASTAISAFVSLTLSPAMAALLLKPHALSHVEKAKPGLLDTAGARRSTGSSASFNRGFERLSNGYGRADGAADPHRRHHAGRLCRPARRSPGNRLAATPTGLIPQLDRAYLIAAMQLPPGSTLERTDARGAPGVRHHRCRGRASTHAVAFVGFDGATFTNAPNTGVIFVTLKPFEERAAGITKDMILADLRGQMFALREAFVFVLEPPSVPGIGTGGGLKGYVQDRAGARPAGARGRDLGAGRRGRTDAGPHPGLHAVQHAHAADLRRHRPHQGRAARRADRARVRDAVGLHGLGLRQRLQHPRPHLSRDRAGRQSLSPDLARRRQSQDAQRQRRDGADRLGRDLQRHHRPLPRAALQSLSRRPRCRSRCSAASPRARASPPSRSAGRARCCRRASASNGPRSRCRRSSPATPPILAFGLAVRVRVPAAGGALRELAAAARRHPDRADVHPGGHDRRQHPRPRPQHPGRDRPGGAGRPRGQERHPDRRVRQAGARGRA